MSKTLETSIPETNCGDINQDNLSLGPCTGRLGRATLHRTPLPRPPAHLATWKKRRRSRRRNRSLRIRRLTPNEHGDTARKHGNHRKQHRRHTQPSVLSLFSPAQRTHNALNTHLTIWQWNCRGFRKKKDHLRLLVQETRLPNTQTPPDVIALQETAVVSLPGYIAYQQFTDQHNQEAPSTRTLVHKSLTAKQHDLEFPDIPHTVVEILPRKRSHQPLFVLNDLHLTLLNDPQQSPTRIGNSVCRDTSPDLGILQEYCAGQVQTSAGKKAANAIARITEWPKFREVRESEAPDSITNLKE
ncbi:hypothetical protein HPB52_011735 [Rhipicephalus sanguineus]|uniref:Tick transposon n=1 Tax=Rhipicephalus sanguineus TaxID=34632 RepID=A0A9D4QGH2_RHISA|nr:hypothetical protein HPB52_011735 [Rhipicephalus sanguineus]